jgi:hypothetical protein
MEELESPKEEEVGEDQGWKFWGISDKGQPKSLKSDPFLDITERALFTIKIMYCCYRICAEAGNVCV